MRTLKKKAKTSSSLLRSNCLLKLLTLLILTCTVNRTGLCFKNVTLDWYRNKLMSREHLWVRDLRITPLIRWLCVWVQQSCHTVLLSHWCLSVCDSRFSVSHSCLSVVNKTGKKTWIYNLITVIYRYGILVFGLKLYWI